MAGITAQVIDDLTPHVGEWDSVVVAGDMHGVAIGAVIAAEFGLPLMIVCTGDHECVTSHIVTIGKCQPTGRYLYADDWFSFGASMRRTFAYMSQSEHAPIVATYAATTRKYTEIKAVTA